MPRTTSPEYLNNYLKLRVIWVEHQVVFRSLSYKHQRLLHDYYQPSKDWATPQLLLEHRAEISKQRPSLPQQAGRALVALRAVWDGGDASLPRAVAMRGGERVVSVRGVARPEPDLVKLSKALIMLARQLQDQEAPGAGRKTTPSR